MLISIPIAHSGYVRHACSNTHVGGSLFMEEIITNDLLDLSSTIKEAFPKAMVTYCKNFDDYYHGWDICPKPGTLIRFSVAMNNPMYIHLVKYTTITYDGTCQMRQMYSGSVPASDEMEPDYGFVKQLLKNWNAVG